MQCPQPQKTAGTFRPLERGREGTDYGTQDVSLATKVLQVRQQLETGTAVLVYDEDTESCTIQPTHQLPDEPGTSSE